MSFRAESKVNTNEYIELLNVTFRLTSMYAEQIMSPEDDKTKEERSEHTQVESTRKRLS